MAFAASSVEDEDDADHGSTLVGTVWKGEEV
jgi:hypothetical protein